MPLDKFKDFYGTEPNYPRLFLLFFLFLISIYYYVDTDAYGAHLGNDVYAQTSKFPENPQIYDSGDNSLVESTNNEKNK